MQNKSKAGVLDVKQGIQTFCLLVYIGQFFDSHVPLEFFNIFGC